MKFPSIVQKLTLVCDAWIIGSAADPSNKNPRDYDVFIPVKDWSKACAIIPSDARVNSLGGFKIVAMDTEIDVWTCNMEDLFASSYFKFAYHPKTGTRIKREVDHA